MIRDSSDGFLRDSSAWGVNGGSICQTQRSGHGNRHPNTAEHGDKSSPSPCQLALDPISKADLASNFSEYHRRWFMSHGKARQRALKSPESRQCEEEKQPSNEKNNRSAGLRGS
ncbi:hypothetical protein GX50_04655 [[Emmonsia] crescens]|uniref:Uncharacterized protein n=1 Tax=[Emmonsia] crescens TaxID=73230 RepID=A0A2B7ZGT9_9EURO|nr:hypothetical protein GX50_04655 [Emmonsia crescens]